LGVSAINFEILGAGGMEGVTVAAAGLTSGPPSVTGCLTDGSSLTVSNDEWVGT